MYIYIYIYICIYSVRVHILRSERCNVHICIAVCLSVQRCTAAYCDKYAAGGDATTTGVHSGNLSAVFTLCCYCSLYHCGFREKSAMWEYPCHPHPWAPVCVFPFSDMGVCARALLSQTCAFALCMRVRAYLRVCTCILLFVLSRSGCVFLCVCVFLPLWS